MIPEIGVMVGIYIVTRMLGMMTVKDRAGVGFSVVRVFGDLTIIVAVFTIASLIDRGTVAGLPGIAGLPGLP